MGVSRRLRYPLLRARCCPAGCAAHLSVCEVSWTGFQVSWIGARISGLRPRNLEPRPSPDRDPVRWQFPFGKISQVCRKEAAAIVLGSGELPSQAAGPLNGIEVERTEIHHDIQFHTEFKRGPPSKPHSAPVRALPCDENRGAAPEFHDRIPGRNPRTVAAPHVTGQGPGQNLSSRLWSSSSAL